MNHPPPPLFGCIAALLLCLRARFNSNLMVLSYASSLNSISSALHHLQRRLFSAQLFLFRCAALSCWIFILGRLQRCACSNKRWWKPRKKSAFYRRTFAACIRSTRRSGASAETGKTVAGRASRSAGERKRRENQICGKRRMHERFESLFVFLGVFPELQRSSSPPLARPAPTFTAPMASRSDSISTRSLHALTRTDWKTMFHNIVSCLFDAIALAYFSRISARARGKAGEQSDFQCNLPNQRKIENEMN